MHCNNCGNPLQPGERFCSICGTPVNPNIMETPTRRPVRVSGSNKRNGGGNRTIKSIILLTVCGLAIGGLIALVLVKLLFSDTSSNKADQTLEENYNLTAETSSDADNVVTGDDLNASTNVTGTRDKLKVLDVTASKSLTSTSNNTYYPSNLIDDNPATCWSMTLPSNKMSGGPTLAGPVFTLDNKTITSIIVYNGYCKSANRHTQNTAPLYIRFSNLDSGYPASDPHSIIYEGILADNMEPQTLKISPTNTAAKKVRRVGVFFNCAPSATQPAYRKGAKWNDLCISEIIFHGK